MKQILFSIAILTSFVACNKDDELTEARTASEWKIGNSKYSTRQVELRHDKSGVYILHGTAASGETFGIILPSGVPTSGRHLLRSRDSGIYDPRFIELAFTYQGKTWIPSNADSIFLQGGSENGIARLVLPDVFVLKDSLSGKDSLLASGIFYEP